jgi:DNA polymerase
MSDLVRVKLGADDDSAAFWAAVLPLDAAGIAPERVVFETADAPANLFAGIAATSPQEAVMTASGKMRPLAEDLRSHLDKVLLHAAPDRFALVYRLLRRQRAAPHLFSIASDMDVSRASAYAKAVRRDMHKMTAFVRFREVPSDDGRQAYIAWFEPEHHIVAATAPFFMKRFASMRWSILTPRRSAHWNGEKLTIAEGRTVADAAAGDPLEEVWKTYYAHIFNPARLKVGAMRAQMPKKYWHNLPEAQLIAPLIQSAQARSAAMIDAGPTQARRRSGVPALMRDGCAPTVHNIAAEAAAPSSVAELSACLESCRRCPLHGHATQAVAGEGPADARLMIVGEQPGDQEDLAGRPFVGPAGQLLDTALSRCGIDRAQTYVTNAVKHFKYEARGKTRLHKSPNASEIDHCRWWLDLEIGFIKPDLIVGLGASAARAILHRSVAVKDVRAQVLPLGTGRHALITVHPSYLLRLRDEEEKRRAWRAFLDDLARARDWLESRAAA